MCHSGALRECCILGRYFLFVDGEGKVKSEWLQYLLKCLHFAEMRGRLWPRLLRALCGPFAFGCIIISWQAGSTCPHGQALWSCSWCRALSQLSNGHFGPQFLFLHRPPISESCFNKHSIKRKNLRVMEGPLLPRRQGCLPQEATFP